MKLTHLILSSDISGVLRYLATLDEEGYNLTQLTKDLIHYLRKVLAVKVDPALLSLFRNEVSSDELKTIEEQSALVREKQHIALIKSLIRAYSEMRYTPLTIVPLEVALIENLKTNT